MVKERNAFKAWNWERDSDSSFRSVGGKIWWKDERVSKLVEHMEIRGEGILMVAVVDSMTVCFLLYCI